MFAFWLSNICTHTGTGSKWGLSKSFHGVCHKQHLSSIQQKWIRHVDQSGQHAREAAWTSACCCVPGTPISGLL